MMEAATALKQATLAAYEGDTDASGNCHGQGRGVFTSGQVYDGSWQHGHMEGAGSMCFPDSISFTGTFTADAMSGSGVYSWPGATYEGEVLNGLRHGHGRLAVADSPVVYEGQWQHGKRHGTGTLYYNTDRTAYYQGDWWDDMKHGQGTSVYPSGNTYRGSWVQDQREGQGSMTWPTSAQHYTGQWAQGLPDGAGEHVWEQQRPGAYLQGSNHAMHVMHNRYVGMFKEGQRHGDGTLFYSSGARYEGQWQHGKKQGQGVYGFEDGNVFCGQFVDDRPVLATGAVLGADSTFPHKLGAGIGSTVQLGSRAVPAKAGDAAALQDSTSRPASTAAAGGRKAQPAAAATKSGAAAGIKAKAGSTAGNQPATATAAGRAKATTAAAAAATATASAAAPSKRASTAGSSASAKSAGRDSTAEGQPGGSGSAVSSSSSCAGPSFGPATSVIQLYISGLLQEYEGQPAAVYKAVSNLLVGFNTELRLLYDRYSCCPSPLLDASSQARSWALQACQLWELLRDAQLLCRHVSLQQVCAMVSRATTPPPAVLQHRQQVELSGTPGVQQCVQGLSGRSCCSPSTQLLFRDFCELLVRLAAARYPLLPSLESQLQQVISYHLLPLLGPSAARQLATASRASVIAAAAAVGAAGGGVEQLLRGQELVQFLQGHAELLQQLYGAFAAAPNSRPQPYEAAEAAADCDSSAATGKERQEGGAGAVCDQGQRPAHGVALAAQRTAATVQQVVSCLQEAGVLGQLQLSTEAAAACMLHTTLAATDPQGARACVEDAADNPPDAADEATSSSGSGAGLGSAKPGPSPAEVSLRHELLFWMDAPLLLQDVLWGLVRLAALLPAACLAPQQQQQPAHTGSAGAQPGAQQQQQKMTTLQGLARVGSAAAAGTGTDVQPAAGPAPAAPSQAGDAALQTYLQLFRCADGCREGWEPAQLLPRLQLLLEGPAGVLRGVLGWAPAEEQQQQQQEALLPCQQGGAGGAGADAGGSGCLDGLQLQSGQEAGDDGEGCGGASDDGLEGSAGQDQELEGDVAEAALPEALDGAVGGD